MVEMVLSFKLLKAIFSPLSFLQIDLRVRDMAFLNHHNLDVLS